MKSRTCISVVVISLSFGGVATVNAASTAISTNTISSFGVTFTPLDLAGTYTFSPFTFSNDAAASEGGGTGGVDMMDAPSACIGDCAGFNNQFYAHTPYSNEFSYGDAKIYDANVTTGLGGSAASIGEVVVNDGSGFATGSNVMTSFISVTHETLVSFAFSADPFMQTMLSSGGLSAASNSFFNITLTNGLGAQVFSWSPDGQIGGITGGTENYDPFSLNLGISGNNTYNPDAGVFSAYTSLLVGSYTLNIKMENQANAAAVNPVPVPAAAWLFGSGLVGLIGFARRK